MNALQVVHQKIDKLLPQDDDSYANERILVALLLWTRVDHDEDSFWESHHQTLVPWMVRLLLAPKNPPALQALYGRLVAQVLQQASSVDDNTQALEPLGMACLQVWEGLLSDTDIKLEHDLLAGLCAWLSPQREWPEKDRILQRLLQRLWSRPRNNNNSNISANDEKVQSNSEDSATQIMIQTLSALHDQTSSLDASLTSLTDTFQQTGMIQLLMQHAQDQMPSFWVDLLRNHSNIPQRERAVWAQVLLWIAAQHATRQVLVPVQHEFTQLLLASVVAVEPSSSLQSLAWSTGAAVLNRCGGWDWLDDKFTCAWLRLAAGEWKIQLSGLVSQQEACLETLQACGQVLVQGLQYMAQVADRMDTTETLPLSAQAMRHMQVSLKQALGTTVEFVGSKEEFDRLQKSNPVAVEPALRVLCMLISEMDAFTGQESEVLSALAVALTCRSAAVETKECLLPALATVLASSEGDDTRITLLEEYSLLALDEFLLDYFQQTTNLESLSWACQVVDLWVSLCHPSATDGSRQQRQDLLNAILECMQRLLCLGDSTHGLATALSSAAACYITLQGSEPPLERDAQIIQQALETSARISGK